MRDRAAVCLPLSLSLSSSLSLSLSLGAAVGQVEDNYLASGRSGVRSPAAAKN